MEFHTDRDMTQVLAETGTEDAAPPFRAAERASRNSRRTKARAGATSAPLAGLLASLADCDLPALRRIWQDRWDAPPPLRSVELLRLVIAWRLQAESQGGLGRTARRQLGRTGRLQAEGQELGAGTRFRREWQGRVVEVVVTPEGFRWEDKVFPSLSAAATAIAGSRWNGPRFFGLREVGR
jgi:hypothetical protein